jgi:hypothetical protein
MQTSARTLIFFFTIKTSLHSFRGLDMEMLKEEDSDEWWFPRQLSVVYLARGYSALPARFNNQSFSRF